eukprot:20736-Eustigmatos_ZCMA.PRE.1
MRARGRPCSRSLHEPDIWAALIPRATPKSSDLQLKSTHRFARKPEAAYQFAGAQQPLAAYNRTSGRLHPLMSMRRL